MVVGAVEDEAPRKKRFDREYMRAVEDWTPRMKREYMREQQRERQREHVEKLMREREELERNAKEALERIGYWDMLELGIATIPGWGDAPPVPSPSASPLPQCAAAAAR